MSSDDRVSGSSASAESRDIPKRVLGPIGRILRTGDPAATIDRLFISQHVADLRLIIAFAFIAVASVFAIGVVLSMVRAYCRDWGFIQRLGVVDSFACEISTLCRVATVVDSVGQSIEMFRHGSPGPDGATNAGSPTRHFTSQENYFPVFENNTRDLQSLEAHVVINITAFYTYMKAVRDSARSLFEMSAPPAQSAPGSNGASTSTPWREAARNVIYMMFLGLESARKAIHELVEFEPDEAERKIIILISELEAYCFLLDQFDESDTHYQRLQLREGDYREAKEDLDRLARDNVSNKSWEPALILMPELERRYDAVMNHSCHSSHYASIA
jgi:hypothetical protein